MGSQYLQRSQNYQIIQKRKDKFVMAKRSKYN